MKTITINNRDLLRKYRFYRDQLMSGTVDKIIIPVNGKCLFMGVEKTKNSTGRWPGDIRPLLEKIKKKGGYKITFHRARGDLRTI